jgi:thiol-disulfide isomerase/thioredoxin
MYRIIKCTGSLVLVLLVKFSLAQTQTIAFQKISFDGALQLSQKTGKLVFIDCYTSWCAPCKWMDQNVFIKDTIYNFYNKNFINLKIDMEKGEGADLRKKYEVASFPTYLFVNGKGDIVHRTASRMEVNEFLSEAKKAVDPSASSTALKEKYEAGDRSNMLLLNYTLALTKIDRSAAEKIRQELITKITDEELSGTEGWQVIMHLARDENDRLGKYLMLHTSHFETIAGKEAVVSVVNRLGMSTMYQLVRDKNEAEFFKRLGQMRVSADRTVQRNVAMLEMEFYLTAGQADSFVAVSNRAMKGVLEYNDADLSFASRRALYLSKGNAAIQQQALLLARRAVELNPEEYSNQGTLASICLELKLKEEGLAAAKKARQLADASTSKIQKLAQELVDKIEKL